MFDFKESFLSFLFVTLMFGLVLSLLCMSLIGILFIPLLEHKYIEWLTNNITYKGTNLEYAGTISYRYLIAIIYVICLPLTILLIIPLYMDLKYTLNNTILKLENNDVSIGN